MGVVSWCVCLGVFTVIGGSLWPNTIRKPAWKLLCRAYIWVCVHLGSS